MKRQLTELEIVRRTKLDQYKLLGVNPFTTHFSKAESARDLAAKFERFSREDLQEHHFATTVHGRIMTMRGPFVVLKDSSGVIQAYIPKQGLTDKEYNVAKLLDIGDIIEVQGEMMKAETGALAVRAKKLRLITKSLRPLPEKFHGLKDVEERYRRRYLDIIMNDQVKETFLTRTKIITLIRKFMDERGYLEADTPILQSILGGAAAKPFKTHHNALDAEFYLRVATELPLKKLIVAGFDKVYEIGRIFRNEGIDTTHNPEFTSIEFYEAFSNLEGMMKTTEEVFAFIAKSLGKKKIEYNGKEINIKAPFARLNMVDAVSKKAGVDFRKITLEKAKKVAKDLGIKIEPYFGIGHIINEIFGEHIEKIIVHPTFVYGHPIEISPLAAKSESDPRFTDRAELFIDGREYANMFTELNDPIDQLERFESQITEREAGNEEANEVDYEFVEALEYGMPPAGGCGIGIDRLVMLFTNMHSIREVLLFPHLRDKEGH